jgi:hypothetical protein
MVKENIIMQVETYMKVNLKMVIDTVKEYIYIHKKVVKYIKVNFNMVKQTVKENLLLQMDLLYMKANLKMANS